MLAGCHTWRFWRPAIRAAPEAEGVLGGLGQRLVRDLGMPAVVAMTKSVGLPTAQALAAGFYNRLPRAR